MLCRRRRPSAPALVWRCGVADCWTDVIVRRPGRLQAGRAAAPTSTLRRRPVRLAQRRPAALADLRALPGDNALEAVNRSGGDLCVQA